MSHYVYSTLATDMDYGTWFKVGDMPTRDKSVIIYGGAHVSKVWDKPKYFETVNGVVTPVTDDDLSVLEQDPIFRLHRDNGFIKVEKKKIDVDKAVSTMSFKDISAPRDDESLSKVTGAKVRKDD